LEHQPPYVLFYFPEDIERLIFEQAAEGDIRSTGHQENQKKTYSGLILT
jgi:hypothetical protein